MNSRISLLLLAPLMGSWSVTAQAVSEGYAPFNAAPSVTPGMPTLLTDDWQRCASLNQDANARLACFDAWAQRQSPTSPSAVAPAAASAALPAPAKADTVSNANDDCKSGAQTALSRHWELEAGSDCGRFSLRGYRPVSLSWINADTINRAPSSPSAGHSASEQPYLPAETRIGLSVRSKIGQGFLNAGDERRDSLWFAYSQQSYWQLFTASISRPFRSTDHEPEIIYVLPTDAALPLGWRLRYSGISLNHQSNGQSLPLSRSWNRVILMAGMEKDTRFTVTGRIWQRMPEDAAEDDNPNISDWVGRSEITGTWYADKVNTLAFTLRHSLNASAHGSYKLDWYRTLGSGKGTRDSGLRFHTQLFSGYGDSLLDYNRQRTVLSIGLSLVDW